MAGKQNADRGNKVVELYNSGLSHAQIAEILGCSRQTIYDICRLRPDYKPRKAMPAECQFFNGVKYTKRANGYFLSTKGDRKLIHRIVWEYYNGPIPENYDVHHRDHNKSNNAIENLEMLPKDEHARRYSTGHNQFTKMEAV
jgi:hypothetical protein